MADFDSPRSPGSFRRMSLKDGKRELQTNDSDDEDGVNDGDEDSGIITLESGVEFSEEDQEAAIVSNKGARGSSGIGSGKKASSKSERDFNADAMRNIPSPPPDVDMGTDDNATIVHQHSHYYTYSPKHPKIFTNLPLRNQSVLVLSQFWDNHPTIQYPSRLEIEAWFLLTQRHHITDELLSDCMSILPKDPTLSDDEDEEGVVQRQEQVDEKNQPYYHSTNKKYDKVNMQTLYSYTPAQETIFEGASLFKMNPIHNKILSRGLLKFSSQKRFVWIDADERRLYWSKDESKAPYTSLEGKLMTAQSISFDRDVLKITSDGKKLLTFCIGSRESSPIHAPSDGVGDIDKTLIFKISATNSDSLKPLATLNDWFDTCMSMCDDYVKIRSEVIMGE